MITMQTPMTEFLALIAVHNPCQEAVDWIGRHSSKNMGDCLAAFTASTSWFEEHRSSTVGHALTESEGDPAWAAWVCTTLADEIDDEVMGGMAQNVRDPMLAFVIARKHPKLRAILRPKYHGKLRRVDESGGLP